MRAGVSALMMVASVSLASVSASFAKDPSPEAIRGLYLTTDFPAVQIRAGEETTLPLTIYNYGLPPQRTAVTIADKPADWKADVEGSGKPVSAAFVDYDGRASLNLKLNIPATAKAGDYKITIKLAEPLAAKLTATPKFPVLRGSPKSSFDFNVAVKNESGADMTVNLRVDAPSGFTTTFKEGYSTQEITSLSIKANENKDITVAVKPGPRAQAGETPILLAITGDKASVQAKLALDISGQPAITVTGQDERLSGEATAGQERSIPLVIRNTGSAPARGVSLSATPPSGWKIAFDPKELPEIAAGEEQKVSALVTPSGKAIAGDYMVSLRASGDGVSESANYRVTVTTSTLWGVTGIAVIIAALLVLVGAVGRFGRR